MMILKKQISWSIGENNKTSIITFLNITTGISINLENKNIQFCQKSSTPNNNQANNSDRIIH